LFKANRYPTTSERTEVKKRGVKMKVAVATSKGGLDDNVFDLFGRCPTYTFVECGGGKIVKSEVLDNPGSSSAEGAGILTARFLAKQGADVVIAGNFGPHATKVLSASTVKLVQAQGKVKESVEKYLAGNLKEVSGATVEEDYCKKKGKVA